MTIYVANPIYDSVFKYLMEDERIARTLLSALLKKEVFDQSKTSCKDRHIIAIDDSCFEGDPDMLYLLRRLNCAASDPDIRQDMNVEDEYFQAIEDRDTAIMNRDKLIAEQESRITEQESRITEQESRITEQESRIAEQEERIHSLKALVQGLVSSGMTVEHIAQMTGQTPEEIRSLL